MKTLGALRIPIITPLLMFLLTGSGLTQSASESMGEAGHSAKEARVNAGHAVVHAYHGTATALSDAAITAKVKTALHDDKIAKRAIFM